MIVGTAGHIDHGKTTLVRALTGVDTDRLPEEKARGISIDLGFAYLDAPRRRERIGFVDVPGHERFVHNMLAGATGIDYALLVVAADDGVMPQTREHLAICRCSACARRGGDHQDRPRRCRARGARCARRDRGAAAPARRCASAPRSPCRRATGEGIAALRERLFERRTAGRRGARRRRAAFRLADRPRLHARRRRHGRHRHACTPAACASATSWCSRRRRAARGARARHARAEPRSAEHGACRPALRAGAGRRREGRRRTRRLARGAGASRWRTDRIDVRADAVAGEAQRAALGHAGARASRRQRRDRRASRCSTRRRARARRRARWRSWCCADRVGAWHGDRFILRDASASAHAGRRPRARSVRAGALPPHAAAPGRSSRAWRARRPARAARCMLAGAPHGLDARAAAARRGACARDATCRCRPMRVARSTTRRRRAGRWRRARSSRPLQRCASAARLPSRAPEELGPDAARGCAAWRCRGWPDALWRALLGGADRATALVAQRGAFVHLPAARPAAVGAEERIAQKIAPLLADGGLRGRLGARPGARRAASRGADAHDPGAPGAARRTAPGGEGPVLSRRHDGAAGGACARDWRGAAAARHRRRAFAMPRGSGRKRAIQVLEYFDRIGLLRRAGRRAPAAAATRDCSEPTCVTAHHATIMNHGRETFLVDRPGFKPGGWRHAPPGGFDSHSLRQ